MSTDTPHQNSYELGQFSRAQGLSLSSNPHRNVQEHVEVFLAWVDGWNDEDERLCSAILGIN